MNENTFARKAAEWHAKAMATSRSCGAAEADAEDIAQDVMLRLWQMRSELDRYRSVEALVAVMARHLTRNHQRRRRTVLLDDTTLQPADQSTPQLLLEERENADWLEARMLTLPTTQHAILYMRQVEQRDSDEIARLLGIGEASVSTLLARARRTLLQEIKERRNEI